jgi:hypothetical protein
MKKWLKTLLITALVIFVAWMVIIHEPQTVRPERVQGFVSGPAAEGMVSVELEDGEIVTVEAPSQLPEIDRLRVSLEVTDYRWSGKRSYSISNWKSK